MEVIWLTRKIYNIKCLNINMSNKNLPQNVDCISHSRGRTQNYYLLLLMIACDTQIKLLSSFTLCLLSIWFALQILRRVTRQLRTSFTTSLSLSPSLNSLCLQSKCLCIVNQSIFGVDKTFSKIVARHIMRAWKLVRVGCHSRWQIHLSNNNTILTK